MESKDFFFFSKRAGNREDDLNTRQRDYMSHSFTARLCFALCKIGLYILFKMNDEIWNPIFQICVTNRLIDKDRKGSIEKYVNIIVSIIAMHIIWIIYPSSLARHIFFNTIDFIGDETTGRVGLIANRSQLESQRNRLLIYIHISLGSWIMINARRSSLTSRRRCAGVVRATWRSLCQGKPGETATVR